MIKFMPQRDPLEELFRRSAEELEQRPGLRGWRRLEQKLDGKANNLARRRDRHQTQGFFKAWHYAAAAIALIMIIMAGLNYTAGQTIDSNLLAKQPESIEEFQLEASSPTRVADYRGISEGERGKILTVRNSSIPRLVPAKKYRL